ncbi:hypothetical protein AB835_12855 [Candidatus Endobugula sertula]|uniref:Solute-binding protein family 3/N-terminal domain-containing protein n=1 Tax=Candidatus Endobugula sertula TaxID=62101 RepID=A0A1D2QM77_9GAMM|nr:hypothetical protein AB835_12855 [Candidatus Endobugula sertula]
MKFFLIIFFLIFSHLVFAQDKITLTTDPYPPYIEKDEKTGIASGIAIEKLNKIFARIPEVELEYYILPSSAWPWKRQMREVEFGRKDGIVMLSHKKEREEYMVFSDTYISGNLNLYYKREKYPNGLEWETLKDLSPYSIGVIAGYYYGSQWTEAEKEGYLKVEKLPTIDSLIKFLMADRADMIMLNGEVANFKLKDLGLSKAVLPLPKPVKTYIWHMSLSKRSNAVKHMSSINRAIRELKLSGEL